MVEFEIDDEDEVLDDLSSPLGLDLTTASSNGARSVIKSLDSDEALYPYLSPFYLVINVLISLIVLVDMRCWFAGLS